MIENIAEKKLEIIIGLFLLGGIIAWLIIPTSFQDTTIILESGGGGAPVSCLPSGGLVLAQNLTDLCDVTIISPTTNQLIQYNGSQWVNVNSGFITTNATCSNLGSGVFVCANSINNVLAFKSLVALDGIQITNSSTEIFIENTITELNDLDDVIIDSDTLTGWDFIRYNGTLGFWQNVENPIFVQFGNNLGSASSLSEGVFVDKTLTGVTDNGILNFKRLLEGTGITLSSNSTHITITNNSPDNTVCTNLGTVGEGIYASGECDFKKLLAGSSISLSANGTRITITNTAPESTDCSNVGTGNFILKTSSIDCVANSLIAGTGITIANTTDDYTFSSQCANTGTGEAVCESSNNINSLIAGNSISITDTTGDLTITNTGAIKLCEVTAVGGETSLACNLSTAPQTIAIGIYHNSSVTNTVWEIRFNADSGNNYAIRSSTNGGADATTANTDSISAVTITANQGYYYTWNCNNPSSDKEKYCYGFRTTSANGAGNVPARVEFASKWANLTSNITSVDLVRTASTGTLTAGSYIVVFGVS